MVKIRPRRPDGGGEEPAHEWHSDEAVDGAAAFGPRDDPDPFGKAFAESRRPAHAARSDQRGPRAGLLIACLVLLAGVLVVALGLADDGDDDDVATVESTSSTTSTSRPRVTTTSSVTSTTGLTSTSLGVATSTTAVGPTVTTTRPTTTLVAPTTTAPANQPLTITISVSPQPVVDRPTPVTVTLTDPDAEPTTNCFVVELDGEVLLEDPCDEDADACPGADDPAIGPSGATRTVDFEVIFDTDGQHRLSATGRSGIPERCNRFADRATEEITVTVLPGE